MMRLGEKKLVLHLGLHKTGTTSFQQYLFPQVEGYLGRFTSDAKSDGTAPRELMLLSERFISAFAAGPPNFGGGLVELVQGLHFDSLPVQLYSNEFLSTWSVSPGHRGRGTPVSSPRLFDAPRRGSHPVVGFLRAIRLALPRDVTLGTVVTVRSQPEYLASLAAQKGVRNFPRVLRRMIRRRDEFLFWHQLVLDCENLVGPENHLTLLFEDGLDINARTMVDFFQLAPRHGELIFNVPRLNSRALEDKSRWVLKPKRQVPIRSFGLRAEAVFGSRRGALKQGKATLRLTERQRKTIRAYCANSNALLEEHLNRDLKSLGY